MALPAPYFNTKKIANAPQLEPSLVDITNVMQQPPVPENIFGGDMQLAAAKEIHSRTSQPRDLVAHATQDYNAARMANRLRENPIDFNVDRLANFTPTPLTAGQQAHQIAMLQKTYDNFQTGGYDFLQRNFADRLGGIEQASIERDRLLDTYTGGDTLSSPLRNRLDVQGYNPITPEEIYNSRDFRQMLHTSPQEADELFQRLAGMDVNTYSEIVESSSQKEVENILESLGGRKELFSGKNYVFDETSGQWGKVTKGVTGAESIQPLSEREKLAFETILPNGKSFMEMVNPNVADYAQTVSRLNALEEERANRQQAQVSYGLPTTSGREKLQGVMAHAAALGSGFLSTPGAVAASVAQTVSNLPKRLGNWWEGQPNRELNDFGDRAWDSSLRRVEGLYRQFDPEIRRAEEEVQRMRDEINLRLWEQRQNDGQ